MNGAMKRVIAGGVFAAVLAGGCANDPYRAPGTSLPDPLPAEYYPQIEAAEGLQGFIVHSKPVVSNDRVLSVTVPLRAATEYEDLKIQYRYVFFDKAGKPVGDEPSWRFTKLASRRQEFLSGNALDSTAVDWRLQLRPAR